MSSSLPGAVPGRPACISELRANHVELIRLMDEVDAASRSLNSDETRLGVLRWKLSQSRRSLRLLVDEMIDQLPQEEKAIRRADIERLRLNVLAVLSETARHNSRWTYAEVVADREGYWFATRRLRELWIRLVKDEQQLLYPDSRSADAAAA